jgi:hypothetical protein
MSTNHVSSVFPVQVQSQQWDAESEEERERPAPTELPTETYDVLLDTFLPTEITVTSVTEICLRQYNIEVHQVAEFAEKEKGLGISACAE